MLVRVGLVLLLSGMLAGCLTAGPWDDCVSQGSVMAPKLAGKYVETAPGTAWQTVLLVPADHAGLDTLSWSASPGWSATSEPLATPEFQRVTIQPGQDAGNATWSFELRHDHGDCTEVQRGSIAWQLANPEASRAAQPGQGVHVMTAGFLDNGTLFYTNIPEIDTDERWPRVPWYAWEGDMPLPVYVYDQDRAEQPAYWKAPSALLPKGTPVDSQLHELGMEADWATGLGYYTTIPGFNAALKGLPATTTHVVRMAPGEGYTRPGNEEHPLYGEALVFLIKVLDVVDAPCPAEAPARFCQDDLPLAAGPAHLA